MKVEVEVIQSPGYMLSGTFIIDVYDFVPPASTTTQYHLIGPGNSMVYTFPTFTLMHKEALSIAQQAITYSLVKSDDSPLPIHY